MKAPKRHHECARSPSSVRRAESASAPTGRLEGLHLSKFGMNDRSRNELDDPRREWQFGHRRVDLDQWNQHLANIPAVDDADAVREDISGLEDRAPGHQIEVPAVWRLNLQAGSKELDDSPAVPFRHEGEIVAGIRRSLLEWRDRPRKGSQPSETVDPAAVLSAEPRHPGGPLQVQVVLSRQVDRRFVIDSRKEIQRIIACPFDSACVAGCGNTAEVRDRVEQPVGGAGNIAAGIGKALTARVGRADAAVAIEIAPNEGPPKRT